MKREKKHSENAMIRCADARTEDDFGVSRDTKRDDWETVVASHWSDGDAPENYDSCGVFRTAKAYVANLSADLDADYCSETDLLSKQDFMSVLSFSFTFDYSSFEWNGTSFDPNDDDAFDDWMASDCLEEESARKEEIVRAFTDYLTQGAAKARAVDSDAYVLWREALVESVFTHHRFVNGVEEAELEKLMDKVEKAARLTWADTEISKRLPKKGESVRKKGKHR